eukprot:m.301821 g.301821  ORF g.301821 m.301821 type:complete len:234 (+) comp22997_c0_seq21:2108-2809(+)
MAAIDEYQFAPEETRAGRDAPQWVSKGLTLAEAVADVLHVVRTELDTDAQRESRRRAFVRVGLARDGDGEYLLYQREAKTDRHLSDRLQKLLTTVHSIKRTRFEAAQAVRSQQQEQQRESLQLQEQQLFRRAQEAVQEIPADTLPLYLAYVWQQQRQIYLRQHHLLAQLQQYHPQHEPEGRVQRQRLEQQYSNLCHLQGTLATQLSLVQQRLTHQQETQSLLQQECPTAEPAL